MSERQGKGNKKLEVVQYPIIGQAGPDTDLYMVVWERIANSGIVYFFAKSEQNAIEMLGYNPKFVKMTVVKIDRGSMPMEIGKAD